MACPNGKILPLQRVTITTTKPKRQPCGPTIFFVELADFQAQMRVLYGKRDAARGKPATVAWLAEEVGELAKAVRKGTAAERLHELGDVLAWLASLADQLELSLEDAAQRYADGCPSCAATPCRCA
jgi:NTP pyrophosphatase (non-canonical NTP hydrolase)